MQNAEVITLIDDSTKRTDCVPAFSISIEEAKERLDNLHRFIREIMVSGVDYGQLPHCKKPTLYKSGAEKLADIFGFSKRLEVVHRVEDLENDFFLYEVKAILLDKETGRIEAEGLGSCNNREAKYAKTDPHAVINTLLKMAKKRAIVDAVLTATRSSGVFTQDIEDLSFASKAERISQTQSVLIRRIIDSHNIPFETAKTIMIEQYQLDHSSKLSKEQADDFISRLRKINFPNSK